jgi:hypothetical protein
LAVFLLTAALSSAGCSVADLNTRQRQERGLVIVLPGIEGKSFCNINIARGLDEGGVTMAIEIFDWTTEVPGGALINLADLERNRRIAEVLGSCIVQYRYHHPGQPVYLVAHSGGAGVAILTLESLRPEVRVSGVVLLAAAVSPTYDLRPALQHTTDGIYNYYSAYDRFLLDVGTRVFGTMDRVHGTAAGSIGFRMPSDFKEPHDQALYRKVHNISWQPEMREYGNWGGHLDWANRNWVRYYLAPLINNPRPLGANPVDSPEN